MAWRLEPTQHPCGVPAFSLSARLVCIFGSIVEAFVLTMFNARQDFALGGAITCELHPSGVPGDDDPRHVLPALHPLSEELLRLGSAPDAQKLDMDRRMLVSPCGYGRTRNTVRLLVILRVSYSLRIV